MNQLSPPDFDRRNRDWYIDKFVQLVVFVGGISAIIFIIGIFVFIAALYLFAWNLLRVGHGIRE